MNRFYSPFLEDSKVQKSDGLFHLLEKIREDPYQYLTSYSVDNLASFLGGYIRVIVDHNISTHDEFNRFDQFVEWVTLKFDAKRGHSWPKIILFHSIDEKDALDKFFTLLDEYQANHSF